jgi:hypothetical protein
MIKIKISTIKLDIFERDTYSIIKLRLAKLHHMNHYNDTQYFKKAIYFGSDQDLRKFMIKWAQLSSIY